ncbi:hypothetical protein C8J57DRAFT_1568187 [Mycena rebaudengoi]|nr:hypothetical protein C8J57DRAFT_1568187 [Mycena rebaudengoi]
MPPFKKSLRDRLSRLGGNIPSPKKAMKRVAAIALSPVKARPQKKRREEEPQDDHATNKENADVFVDNSNPSGACETEFHQGSIPEPPTAAPMAFKLRGKFTAGPGPEHDSDRADCESTHTFPTPHEPSMLGDDDDLESEIVPPELDELCAADSGTFGGDGYPRPAPPKTFVEKMAAIGVKQAVAVAPDISSAKAALTDMELVLRGPSRVPGFEIEWKAFAAT